MKKLNFVLLFCILFFSLMTVSAYTGGYTYSNPKLSGSSSFQSYATSFGSLSFNSQSFDHSMCDEGQDFLLRIDSTKCTPIIVRSDLLEENDIPVYCPIQAIKMNPLIEISMIDSISFSGNYPPQVKTIGFTPVHSALGGNRQLNEYQWNNIGYLTVILRRDSNESAMPESIDLDLKARIHYDIKGGLNLMTHSFYLPVIDDYTFDKDMGKYSFFNKIGYLRAEEVTENSATISIYNGVYKNSMNTNSMERQRVNTFDLAVGKSSPLISLPGYECLSKVKFTLKSVDYADTSAMFLVNSEYFSAREEETFFDGLCTVKSINNMGLYQGVKIHCSQTDEGSKVFDLKISPKVLFDFGGKKVSVSLGEKIGTSSEGKDLFLGYIGENGSDYRALIVSVPSEKGLEKLSDSDLKTAEFIGDTAMKDSSKAWSILGGISAGSVEIYKYLQSGKTLPWVEQGKTVEISGSQINLVGLGLRSNEVLNSEIKNSYKFAIADYDLVISRYESERYPDDFSEYQGKIAIENKIGLASELRQFSDVNDFCLEFQQRFASSNAPEICSDYLLLSNEGVSTAEILINGKYKTISFRGVYEPDLEDYGAVILVKNLKNGEMQAVSLRKNNKFLLPGSTTNEYISLEKVENNLVRVSYSLTDSLRSTRTSGIFSSTVALTTGVPSKLSENYEFTLQKIYLNKMAHVIAEPTIGYQKSEVEFQHKIGIEKRMIQLSPEKARSIASNVNDTINILNDITKNLDTVTEVMNAACLATGGYLTLKNIFTGSKGEVQARKEVMNYWKDECSKEVDKKIHRSLDACYINKSNLIDAEVEKLTTIIKTQEEKLNKIVTENGLVLSKGGVFGDDIIDEKSLAGSYSKDIIETLNKLSEDEGDTLKSKLKSDEEIKFGDIKNILEEGNKAGEVYDVNDLKKIEQYYQLYTNENDKQKKEYYFNKLYSSLDSIKTQDEKVTEHNNQISQTKSSAESMGVLIYSDKKAIVGEYGGYKVTKDDEFHRVNKSDELINTPIQKINLEGKIYYVTLKPKGVDGIYEIVGVYNSSGNYLEAQGASGVANFYSSFKLPNSGTYNYKIQETDFQIKYYDYGEYKGLPSVVPFDKNSGWYAVIDNSIGSTTSFDLSGRVSSFKLCNVMEDGKISPVSGGGLDECMIISLSNIDDIGFGRLGKEETKKLIDRAVKAIRAANNHQSKKGAINVDGVLIPIGSPMGTSSISQESCSDYMSPKECNILFNVCDPVICPESRCDYGGKYPVQNVIQSGIVGSAMLCAPNYKEGIKVPVCITGINAGLKSLNSVFTAYRDCLIENADSGRTIGICDEIHSIYYCEFIWKQAIPLAKIALPSVVDKVLNGEKSRGGREYFSLKQSWDNAQESIKYFTQSYALQSSKAFKARSTEQVGTDVCKTFISVVYPTSLGSLSALTESANPPQFIATFEEIIHSTATNPPSSQYKVYYHIYSGTDTGVYYSVYLRGKTGSYYEDANVGRRVDSGYIAAGNYKSETIDFLGPSGYNELCVRINDQREECGFGRVSTSFAVNYLSDAYVREQASNTKISTEEECVRGTHSLMSLLNLNLQSGLNELISPDIVSKGIVRICSTNSPGMGVDPNYGDGNPTNDRWLSVGYCGEESLKCWIDTESLKKAFEFSYEYDKTLETGLADAKGSAVEDFLAKYGLWDNTKFDDFIRINLSESKTPEENITKIENIFDLLAHNNQKGLALIFRGDAYSSIVKTLWGPYYRDLLKKRIVVEEIVSLDQGGYEVQRQLTLKDLIEREDFVSPIFEIDTNRNINFCYTYFDGQWWWTDECGPQEKIDTAYVPGAGSINFYSKGEVIWNSTSQGVFDLKYKLDEELIRSLRGKNYVDGMEILVGRLNLGNAYAKNIFVKDKNTYLKREFYNLYDVESVSEIYFRYEIGQNSRWQWSYDGKDWLELNNLVDKKKERSLIGGWINSIFSSESTQLKPDEISKFPEKYKVLFKFLEGKNKLDGTILILLNESDWKTLSETIFVGGINWDLVPDCKKYESLFNEYSQKTGVPVGLLISLVYQESRCNPYAVSYTGAAGLFQFTASTAKDYPAIFENVVSCTGVSSTVGSSSCNCNTQCDANSIVNSCGCSLNDDRFNVTKSFDAGTRYINKLIREFDSNYYLALIAYNAGSGVSKNVQKNLRTKPSEGYTWENIQSKINVEVLDFDVYRNMDKVKKVEEIKNYVEKITSLWNKLIVYEAKTKMEIEKEEKLVEESIIINNLGQKIFYVAKDLAMNEANICRYEGSDKKFNNVCVAFVATVLIDSGVLNEKDYVEGVEALYNKLKDNSNYSIITSDKWLEGLLPGDVVIWGGDKNQGYKEVFQHATIFSKYGEEGNSYFCIIHEGGETLPVLEKCYSLSSHQNRSWYITHVFRYVGGNLLEEVEEIIEVATSSSTNIQKQEIFMTTGLWDLSERERLYYRYSDIFSVWQWSPEKTFWMNVSQDTVVGGEENGKRPTKKNLKIISSLRDKNYSQGKMILNENGAIMENKSKIVIENAPSTRN